MAKHVTTKECSVVRSGNRFGLRVLVADAPEVHQQHRPEAGYLEGTKTAYKVGPLPYGTTKKALAKALLQLGWTTNPGQPMGQSDEGCFWSVTAAAPPSHWIFTLKHGDVLISPKEDKEQPQQAQRQPVIASSKTLQFLQAGPKQVDRTKADPWLTDDPWTKYAPTNTSSSARVMQPQLASMENNIAQKVLDQIKQQDAPMSELDPKVEQLEAQVKTLTTNLEQLSSTVASNQASQTSHNNHVQNQLGGLKHQMESQAAAFQKAIETKFEDQMRGIESLLNKRAKLGE